MILLVPSKKWTPLYEFWSVGGKSAFSIGITLLHLRHHGKVLFKIEGFVMLYRAGSK